MNDAGGETPRRAVLLHSRSNRPEPGCMLFCNDFQIMLLQNLDFVIRLHRGPFQSFYGHGVRAEGVSETILLPDNSGNASRVCFGELKLFSGLDQSFSFNEGG